MKTLKQWQDKLHAENRIMLEVSVSEAQQIIDCIAIEWMQGKAKTLAYPTALQSISFALKSASERKADYKATASDLGRLGGSKSSEAKTKAVRANGRLGGRPKQEKKDTEQTYPNKTAK